MPYDPPNQAAWMNGSSDGYAAYEVGPSVTTHRPTASAVTATSTSTPPWSRTTPSRRRTCSGVQLHDLLTVSLGNVGVIEHVINETGAATPTNTTPSTVTSFP